MLEQYIYFLNEKLNGEIDLSLKKYIDTKASSEFGIDFNDKKKITNIMTFRGVVLTKNKFDKFIRKYIPEKKQHHREKVL